MDCITKLLRFTIRILTTATERFSKGTSNPCSDGVSTLQPGELGINLADATVEIGAASDIAQIPCAVAGAGDHGKIFIWNDTTKKFDLTLPSGGGDFSNGGDAGGANRTLGNTDSFKLGFLTDNNERVTILSDGKVGVNNTGPSRQFSVDGDAEINQTDPGSFDSVLDLTQGSTSAPMQSYNGMESFDSSSSLSNSMTEMGMKTGAIRITINGFTQWIRFYDTAE